MNITIEELKMLIDNNKGNSPHPFIIGEKYFIRTVTMNLTGVLESVGDKELVLSSSAWIADSGRFTQALETSNFNEVEMFPRNSKVIVGRGALIDATVISNIPTSQK